MLKNEKKGGERKDQEMEQEQSKRMTKDAIIQELIELLNQNQQKGAANDVFEAAVEEYADWKEEIEETKLPNVFSNVKYDNLQSFFVSLQNQSNLSNSWITESMNRFAKWFSI